MFNLRWSFTNGISCPAFVMFANKTSFRLAADVHQSVFQEYCSADERCLVRYVPELLNYARDGRYSQCLSVEESLRGGGVRLRQPKWHVDDCLVAGTIAPDRGEGIPPGASSFVVDLLARNLEFVFSTNVSLTLGYEKLFL